MKKNHFRDKNTMIEREIDRETDETIGRRAPRHDLSPRRTPTNGAVNSEPLGYRVPKPLNRAASREIIFQRLRDLRGPYLAEKFKQISGGSFDYLDRRALQFIEADLEAEGGYFDQLEKRMVALFEDYIRRHPTRGSTLKFPPQL